MPVSVLLEAKDIINALNSGRSKRLQVDKHNPATEDS